MTEPQRYDMTEREIEVERTTDDRNREVVALYADGKLVFSFSLPGALEIARRLGEAAR